VIPPAQRRSHLARQVGTLLLSEVRTSNPMAVVRAAAWSNIMARVGIRLPLFVVHDFGLLLTTRQNGVTIGSHLAAGAAKRFDPNFETTRSRYRELLSKVAQSEVVERASSLRLRDDIIAVLLTRILGDLFYRFSDPVKALVGEELPLDPQIYVDADVEGHFADFDQIPALQFLSFLTAQQLHVYTSLEQIDLDTLRLLGVFSLGARGLEAGAVDLVDLMGAFRSSEPSDIVSFSLDLLPSVLETKRASGVQSFAIDGYSSIERHGPLDSIMLSEFAYEDELFERKVVDHELYYYGHEKQREEERRLKYLLIDASPSMRGVRQVFARGLALTLAKKLSLEGHEVWLRFFDSRLYEIQKLRRNDSAAPYLLCFRSERGRNSGKVIRQLQFELHRLRQEERRQVEIYLLTHGQCHIPVELVERLRKDAFLYGIFILPSKEMKIDYLHLLHRHQIVDEAALRTRKERRDRALQILDDAGASDSQSPTTTDPRGARP
jgi:hypothetical protein